MAGANLILAQNKIIWTECYVLLILLRLSNEAGRNIVALITGHTLHGSNLAAVSSLSQNWRGYWRKIAGALADRETFKAEVT